MGVVYGTGGYAGGMVRDGSQRALFLDRDGVINEEIGYLYRPEDVRWMPGIFSLCRAAEALGYRVVVVTNQSGIARGLYGVEEFEALMSWMRREFGREGVTLDAVYYCPFHPTEGLGEWRREHEDRKPGPGMILRAAAELGLDLGGSVMVGDRCTDVLAGRAAGVGRMVLVGSGVCGEECLRVKGLGEVEEWLRGLGG